MRRFRRAFTEQGRCFLLRGHSQSDVTIDRVTLPVGAYGGAILCTALTAAILYASPSRLASTLKYQSHILFAPIVRALGLKESPHNIGRAIQGFWLVALYGAHLAEAMFCLPPHLKAYNVKNKAVRLTYVRARRGPCRSFAKRRLII